MSETETLLAETIKNNPSNELDASFTNLARRPIGPGKLPCNTDKNGSSGANVAFGLPSLAGQRSSVSDSNFTDMSHGGFSSPEGEPQTRDSHLPPQAPQSFSSIPMTQPPNSIMDPPSVMSLPTQVSAGGVSTSSPSLGGQAQGGLRSTNTSTSRSQRAGASASKMTKSVECWGSGKPFASLCQSTLAKNITLTVSWALRMLNWSSIGYYSKVSRP